LSSTFVAKCLDCKHQFRYSPYILGCPHCGSTWSEARYNYKEIGSKFPLLLEPRPSNMWRYRELLPVYNYQPEYTMGEGGTPLTHATNLGIMLGCKNIYIKDERQGPTNSFKDRQAAVSIASLKESGINEAVLASTGNVAIAYSAYAARAGIKLWAFLTSLVPPEKMREVAIYGTQVVKVTATYDQAKVVAAEFAHQRGLYLERGASTIPSLEAMKTIAYEIVEQVTAVKTSESRPATQEPFPWQVPDWYFQSVSGGLGPLGVLKGFNELKEMGITDRIPAIAIIQAEGCAPMVHAWKQGLEVAEPVKSPRTHIATLATGDPGRTYTLLTQRMREANGGTFELVSDEETFRTMHILAKLEGLSVEPAAAVAFSGLIKAARAGLIKPDDFVVVNCTGHTMSVDKRILGDGWGHKIVLPSQSIDQTPEEGLLAALSQVSAKRYPRIAIVDDTPDARTLIRRILQTQGEYTFFEAEDGGSAVEIAQRELPDLIILDLMMPVVDGFSVLDALKTDPQTATIPVIVVTAKELTREERIRIKNQTHSLMQKGEFMDDELLDEVRALLN
jgi:threonine synthase